MKWTLIIALAIPIGFACGCRTPFPTVPGSNKIDKLGQVTGLNPSDEAQIAAVLEDTCLGMQTRRIFKVLAHLSRNYRDAEGRDYAAMEQYLSDIFKSYRTIRITRAAPRIQIEGDQAQVMETFGTIAEPADPRQEPPINLQGQVQLDLTKVDGEWLIVEWGRIL